MDCGIANRAGNLLTSRPFYARVTPYAKEGIEKPIDLSKLGRIPAGNCGELLQFLK